MEIHATQRRRVNAFRKGGWLAVAALVTTALFVTPGVALGHDASVHVSLSCDGTVTYGIENWTSNDTGGQAETSFTVSYSIDGGTTWIPLPGAPQVQFTPANVLASAVSPGILGPTFNVGTASSVLVSALAAVWADGESYPGPYVGGPATRTDCPSPSPSPSVSPSPSPSVSPSPSPSPSPSVSPSPSPSPSPSVSPSPSPSLAEPLAEPLAERVAEPLAERVAEPLADWGSRRCDGHAPRHAAIHVDHPDDPGWSCRQLPADRPAGPGRASCGRPAPDAGPGRAGSPPLEQPPPSAARTPPDQPAAFSMYDRPGRIAWRCKPTPGCGANCWPEANGVTARCGRKEASSGHRTDADPRRRERPPRTPTGDRSRNDPCRWRVARVRRRVARVALDLRADQATPIFDLGWCRIAALRQVRGGSRAPDPERPGSCPGCSRVRPDHATASTGWNVSTGPGRTHSVTTVNTMSTGRSIRCSPVGKPGPDGTGRVPPGGPESGVQAGPTSDGES